MSKINEFNFLFNYCFMFKVGNAEEAIHCTLRLKTQIFPKQIKIKPLVLHLLKRKRRRRRKKAWGFPFSRTTLRLSTSLKRKP